MKKLNLKELELKLPRIDESYSKILLGGDSYADDAVFGGGCDVIRDKEIGQADIGWDAPLDYDNAYDLDVSIDGLNSYDDGSSGDEQGSSSSGGVTSYAGGSFYNNLPQAFTNGVDLADYPISGGMNLGDFNTTFIEQFKTILETNNVIANALNYIKSVGVNLDFSIDQIINNIPGQDTNAHTEPHFNTNSISITFNIDQMNPDDGWEDDSHGSNATESLVETILHEILHAKHAAQAMDIKNQLVASGQFTIENYYNAMANAYTSSFAEMYINFDSSTNAYSYVTDGETRNNLEHAYMNANESQLLEDAKNEFNDDIVELQNYVYSLEAMIQQAEQNLGSGVDPTSGVNGPTNQQLQQQYNNLVSELNDLLQNFGWLFHIND